MSNVRVLCVENHPEYMGALKYMLETAGYEVTAATSGDQALHLLTTLTWTAFSWNTICQMLQAARYERR